ncbi:hypothetical protein TNCV_2556891 [Trichonephila clavipes]|nr:hypothetical protein TNCV_2556891 [Trichonephila clavipes]
MIRFAQGSANAEAGGIQCLLHRWQRLSRVHRGSLGPGLNGAPQKYLIVLKEGRLDLGTFRSEHEYLSDHAKTIVFA